MLKTLNIIHLDCYPILEQLWLEEALLRNGQGNYCLINRGTPPAIVMGISGKAEELIAFDKCSAPIIRRFSGGGTVFVDEETLFMTLICNESDIAISPYPRTIMEWSATLYHPIFERADFNIRENDYVFGDKKFGGNAQYIQRGRWLHHTSFLWDFEAKNMESLLLPPKMPSYREKRTHSDFLCRLKDFFVSKEELCDKISRHLSTQFLLRTPSPNALEQLLAMPHRRSSAQYFAGSEGAPP